MPRLVEMSVEDPRLKIETASAERLIHFLDTQDLPWSLPPGDLSIAFVDDARCRELHARFFQDDRVTDVMTFPGSPEDEHAGDLAICPAHAAIQAPVYEQDFAEELTLYLIHGWLHLAGLDDTNPTASAEMRAAENLLVTRLLPKQLALNAAWTAQDKTSRC